MHWRRPDRHRYLPKSEEEAILTLANSDLRSPQGAPPRSRATQHRQYYHRPEVRLLGLQAAPREGVQ